MILDSVRKSLTLDGFLYSVQECCGIPNRSARTILQLLSRPSNERVVSPDRAVEPPSPIENVKPRSAHFKNKNTLLSLRGGPPMLEEDLRQTEKVNKMVYVF